MCAVELSEAGDGTVEILITDPNGQLIPHQVIDVKPSLLEVHYTPMIGGLHRACVSYNGAAVPGCFQMDYCLVFMAWPPVAPDYAKKFQKVLNNQNRVLHKLLPEQSTHDYYLRPRSHDRSLCVNTDNNNFFK